VRPPLAQREFALGAVALLAGVVSLAVAAHTRSHHSPLPRAVGSYTALAGSIGSESIGRRTACGTVILATTEGVAHPTLPCGARIYVAYHGRHVLTQVIDRGPYLPGREFDLTDALARRLGLTGVKRIEWSYAATG
jgi:rare lipoprotein A